MDARRPTIAALVAGAATIVAIPLLAQQKPASGPIARYDMRAGTVAGAGAMGGGGGSQRQQDCRPRGGAGGLLGGGC